MNITQEDEERQAQYPTLRDQFAMAALTGLIACPEITIGNENRYAKRAYQYADAMLKAREEKEQP